MKLAMSTLNPYAASYVPLSKRESNDTSDVAGWPAKGSRGENQMAWYGPAEHALQSRRHDKAPSVSGASIMKSQSAVNFSGPSSENQNEVVKKRGVDLEFEMDLDYLQMSFPGISDDSLADVYTANGGDLEASIDMLNQLEELQCVTLEPPSQNLPDSLDIGDFCESMSAAECSSVKLKNVVVEVSTRNGSSDSVIIN